MEIISAFHLHGIFVFESLITQTNSFWWNACVQQTHTHMKLFVDWLFQSVPCPIHSTKKQICAQKLYPWSIFIPPPLRIVVRRRWRLTWHDMSPNENIPMNEMRNFRYCTHAPIQHSIAMKLRCVCNSIISFVKVFPSRYLVGIVHISYGVPDI